MCYNLQNLNVFWAAYSISKMQTIFPLAEWNKNVPKCYTNRFAFALHSGSGKHIAPAFVHTATDDLYTYALTRSDAHTHTHT